MPIEFTCKYCNAMIRVPDSAKGGKGRCPKCGVRITVPRKSTIQIDQSPPEPAAAGQEFLIPGVTDETIAYQSQPTVKPASTDDSVVLLETAHPEPGETPPAQTSPTRERPTYSEPNSIANPADPRPGQFPFITAPSSSAVRQAAPQPKPKPQRKKHRGDSNRTLYIVGGVLILLLAGMGIAIFSPMFADKLEGNLVAGTSEQIELPPVIIPQSQIPYDGGELPTLLKKLERNPLPMTSSNMRVELSATSAGLKISVEPGLQSRFYRVSTGSNDVILKYLTKHLAEFEEQRTKEVERTAGEFLATYQKVIDKQVSSDSISGFRDRLALPALVKGFGNRVVAAAGRNLYPCVYEDSEGGLYFLLPAGLQSFLLVGREDDASRSIAKTEFNVTVKGEIALPKSLKPQNAQKENSKTDAKTEKPSEKSDEMKNGEK